jgi:nucleoid-associated protein YgaU
MKRFLVLLFVVAFTCSFSGCVTVRKVVRERVDQDVQGNQGYLMGSSDAYKEPGPSDREYIDIRVEMPTWEEVTAPPVRHEADTPKKPAKATEYKDTSTGNKGYISANGNADTYSAKPKPETTAVYEYDDYEVDIYDDQGDVYIYEEQVIKPAYQEYTVKEGETLSHIAKAFYNKASKWTVIYEANSDKIKDPSKVRAGTKLRIPDLEQVEQKYVK